MPRTAGIVSLPLPVEDSIHSSLSSDSIEATSKAGLTGRVYKHRCSDQGDGAHRRSSWREGGNPSLNEDHPPSSRTPSHSPTKGGALLLMLLGHAQGTDKEDVTCSPQPTDDWGGAYQLQPASTMPNSTTNTA